MTRIATIARNPADSPNMTANDAAILESVAVELKACGAEVVSINEDEDIPFDIQAVCTMSRTESIIARLREAENSGITVINSSVAVENCSRKQFMELLRDNAVPQPTFKVVRSVAELNDTQLPCWIKKAKGWSNHKEDICFTQTINEAKTAVLQMAQRGITECIQMLHCQGDIIKFYGVGKDFFHYCYPQDSKFGLESINGAPGHYAFDTTALKAAAQKAATVVGLEVYGGDAIVDPQGRIYIIDINDFPSFTAIRSTAAKEIAKLIMKKTKL